ncbi:MAG: flavoprotein [Candidatus Auribacterota bacterium]|jgi:phosphopantothenoylcysteine decarboxylase/phosphopantothenate--cysteine ligase|nr:flavoprotein [Candidatus Auribacterota bacterium]
MSSAFAKKHILVGVTGSIAAYKACDLVSRLVEMQAHTTVVMTRSAMRFVRPLSFESLTGEPVITSLWKRTKEYRRTVHISLAQSIDCALIAPASANIIAKLRIGICDDALSCIMCACKKPVIIAPAMNDQMYTNPATQENIEILKGRGVTFIDPAEGRLACGTTGKGRLADVDCILQTLISVLSR